MKKYVKLIAVLLLTVVLCLSFCSCKELDEMRAKQAIWGDDARTVINFRGAEYKLLPACNDLAVIPSGQGNGVVTQPDVPVLLSDNYGIRMNISKGLEMVVVGIWEDNWKCSKVYCRSDLYEEKVRAIETYEMNRYCVVDPVYEVYEMEEEDVTYGEYVSMYRMLSDESHTIVRTALSGEGRQERELGHVEETFHLCDRTLQFVDEDDCFYIVSEGESFSIVVRNSSDGVSSNTYYDIPAESAKALLADIRNWISNTR